MGSRGTYRRVTGYVPWGRRARTYGACAGKSVGGGVWRVKLPFGHSWGSAQRITLEMVLGRERER